MDEAVNFTLYLSARAVMELKEAAEYYAKVSNSVNDRFGIIMERTLLLIAKNPLAYAIRYGTMRCAVINEFPYVIHFELEESTGIIRVTSIFNTYRNPADLSKD